MSTAGSQNGHPLLCSCNACQAVTAGAAPAQSAAASGAALTAAASGTSYIDALLSPGDYRWNPYAAPGTPLTVTYGFMTTMPWYVYSWANERDPFVPFTQAQRDAVNRAVALYEQVCKVDFVYRADGDNAQIRFGTALLDASEAAHTYYPDPSGDWGGDVWFNSLEQSVTKPDPSAYGFMVVLHEMGHALGLKHSFYDGTFSGTVLPSAQDNRQYTVMSYNKPPTAPDIEPSSLMLYDIAALQYLYGANTSYASGDDRWRWGTNETFRMCIWDGGGNDTIDASNQTRRVIIDLNPGSFSSLGSYRGGDITDNLSIAYNCWIENAIGGSGNDTITGNQLANRLEGGAGNDVIKGGDGNDVLDGGAGVDTLSGGSGDDVYVVSTGDKVLEDFGSGFDEARTDVASFVIPQNVEKLVFVGTGAFDGRGSAFSDTIIGGSGDDRLSGFAGNDTLDGGSAGIDTAVYSGNRSDYLITRGSGQVTVLDQRPGAPDGSDTLYGVEVLAFADGPYVVNHAPVVSASNRTAPRAATSLSASTLFSVSDVESDAITRYRFWDDMVGGGRLVLGATQQVEKANIEITAAQLANLNFALGAPLTSDLLWVQAYDGFAWGAWKSFTVTAPPNQAPIAAGIAQSPGKHATTIAAASLVSATDADGDPIQSYEFWDSGLEANSGHFARSGNALNSNVSIPIAAAAIGDLSFQLGTVSDQLWVRAFDGTSWSTWQEFTVAAPANLAPVVTIPVPNVTPLHGLSIAASSLFTFSDPDGDAPQRYEFWDSGLDPNSGRFVLNGAVQGVDVAVPVSAADLTNLSFRFGTVSDQLWVRAFDGTAWSTWESVNVAAPPNVAPTVSIVSASYTPGHGATIAASTLFSADDPDGDTITQYRFWDDTAGNGRFQLNGIDQIEMGNITIDAADLAHFTYKTSTTGSGDVVWMQAFDGISWSTWKSVNVAAPPNAAPVIAISNLNVTPAHGTTSIAASDLFGVSDPDGDTIQKYELWDSGLDPNSGRFVLSGTAQGVNIAIPVTAVNLGNLSFRLSTVSDELWVRAFDGTAWSAWKSLNVAAPPNTAPAASASDKTQAANTAVEASTLFSMTDADGDTMTRYRFWDSTPGGGTFRINGTSQPVNANIDVMANQLAATDFLTGSNAASDQLWVQAFDGAAWSAWKSFTITTLASS